MTADKTPGAMVLDEVPHMIVFDDADREPILFAGCGARQAALKTWEQVSRSWNAHLFVRVERNSRDDRYPSAKLADHIEDARAMVEQTPAVGGEPDAFSEDQWWLPELDSAVANGTPDQKRAVAVVRALIKQHAPLLTRTAELEAEAGDTLALRTAVKLRNNTINQLRGKAKEKLVYVRECNRELVALRQQIAELEAQLRDLK